MFRWRPLRVLAFGFACLLFSASLSYPFLGSKARWHFRRGHHVSTRSEFTGKKSMLDSDSTHMLLSAVTAHLHPTGLIIILSHKF